jgi:hypothetical protein
MGPLENTGDKILRHRAADFLQQEVAVNVSAQLYNPVQGVVVDPDREITLFQ